MFYLGVLSESNINLYFSLFPLESSLVFVPRIETVLATMKYVRTKDMFCHSNVEFSYIFLLISLPSRIYTPTMHSYINSVRSYLIVHFSNLCLYVCLTSCIFTTILSNSLCKKDCYVFFLCIS